MISNTLKEGKRQYDADEVSREPLDPTLPPDANQIYRNLWLFIWLKTIVSYDSGCFSAALGAENGIAEDWALSTVQQGTLSSSVFLGNVLGCLFAGHLFSTHHEKNVLLCTQLFHTLFTFLFATFPDYRIALLNRFLLGLSLAFPVVYTPVWVDAFAPKERQSVWMASHNAGVPLGVMIGYVLGAFFPSYIGLGWEWAFYLKCVLMVPTLVYMAKVSSRTINASGKLAPHHNNNNNNNNSSSINTVNTTAALVGQQGSGNNSSSNSNSVSNGESSSNNNNNMSGIYARRPPWLLIGGTVCGYASRAVQECGACGRQMLHSVGALRPLLSNVVYICSVLGMCSLYFVATGVQNFVTQYLRNEPFNAPMRTIMIGFGTSLVIAPVCGVIIGGMLLDRCGGYHGNLLFVSLYSLIWGGAAATFAIVCTYITTTGAFLVVMSLVLFCGGAIIPSGAGLTMASLPQSLRPLGAAFSQTVYNLLGNFSGPLVCGWVAEWTGQLKYGIITLLLSSIVGVVPVFVILVIALRRRAAAAAAAASSLRPFFITTANGMTTMTMANDSTAVLMSPYADSGTALHLATSTTTTTTTTRQAQQQQALHAQLMDELKAEPVLPAETMGVSSVEVEDGFARGLSYLANNPPDLAARATALVVPSPLIGLRAMLPEDAASGASSRAEPNDGVDTNKQGKEEEEEEGEGRMDGAGQKVSAATGRRKYIYDVKTLATNASLASRPNNNNAGGGSTQSNFLRTLTARRLYNTGHSTPGVEQGAGTRVSPTGSLDSLVTMNGSGRVTNVGEEGNAATLPPAAATAATLAARRTHEAFAVPLDRTRTGSNTNGVMLQARRDGQGGFASHVVQGKRKGNAITQGGKEDDDEDVEPGRRMSRDSSCTTSSSSAASATRPFMFSARSVPHFMQPARQTLQGQGEHVVTPTPPQPPLQVAAQPVVFYNTKNTNNSNNNGATNANNAQPASPCLAEVDSVPTLSISDSFSFGMDVVRTWRHAHEESARPVPPQAMVSPPQSSAQASQQHQQQASSVVSRASSTTPPPPRSSPSVQAPHADDNAAAP